MFGGGYQGVKRDDGEEMEKKTINTQYLLLIIGVISALVALANFSICIWIRFDLDFWEWIDEIGWYSYWNAVYVVMVAMLATALNSGLMCYAVMSESRGLILVSMILRCLFWCLTLAGAIIICVYGVEESSILVNELNEVFTGLINRWDDDPRSSRVMTMIQEYVGCCGASNNRDDYFKVKKVVPYSCRHPITGNNYRYGCPQTLAWWLEPWSACLAGVSLFFSATDIFVLILNVKLRRFFSELEN